MRGAAYLSKSPDGTRGSVLEAMKKTVAEYGFTAAELFGTTPAAKPKGKVKTTKRGPAVVKYQDEVGNTWGGGKGPRPAWVKAIQGAGGDIEKYLVVDAQKAAAQRLAAVGGSTRYGRYTTPKRHGINALHK